MSDTPQQPPSNEEQKKPLDAYERASQALVHIFLKTDRKPTLGIILGSGLGNFASQVEDATIIPYADIPHWPPVHGAGPLRQTRHRNNRRGLGGSDAGPRPRLRRLSDLRSRLPHARARKARLQGPDRDERRGRHQQSFGQGGLVCISDHINLTGTNAALGPNEAAFRRERRFSPALLRHVQRLLPQTSAPSPPPKPQSKTSRSPKASTSPSSAPATKPPPKFAPSAPSAPTW